MKRKNFIRIFLLLLFLFTPLFSIFAQNPNEKKVNIYFFNRVGCPHCVKEEKFLNKLENQKEYKDKINVKSFEISKNPENAKLLSRVGQELNIEVPGVPITIIGDKHVVGFYNEESTGKKIKKIIDEALQTSCTDYVSPVINNQEGESKNQSCEEEEEPLETIDLPIFGTLEVKNFSLPALTVAIAAIDGFNPCAMWVLLFLISLLLGMESRKKMWLLGGAFILTSAVVYFLFLSAWLNLFLFIGFLFWIRLLIGIVAIGSGVYHVREFFVNKEGTCKVTGNEKRKKVFYKLKNIINNKNLLLALGGIIVLAVAVNMIELVCSAGLPAIYTQILALSDLAAWKYYGLLLLYVVIFMLDDFLIFFIAMKTLQVKGVSGKFNRWAGFIGGIIILILGVLLLFKPEWLMFG